VNGHLLVSRMYPRLVEMLAREDLQLLLMETTEIAKVDAGLTCMSLRWQQDA
jgi:dimethylargininase